MADALLLRYPGTTVRSRVRVARGSLDTLGDFVAGLASPSRVVVVTDPRVASLHGARAQRSLRRAGLDATWLRIPRGERAKDPRHVAALWERFGRIGLDRAGLVVAFGGGVVGDVAGFAAACWLRGVAWVGVPTTVLSQVDSSVGGKTGVDLAAGKNLVGAFHQPLGVLVDPDVLRTLPPRERRAGLAEVVKMGMACDASLFAWCERRRHELSRGEPAALASAVLRAIRVKARVVQRDEREAGPRTALNFGHTTGHALEAALGYRGLRHGEAVAIGMRLAARLSVRLAGLEPAVVRRLDVVLDSLRLPRRLPAVGVNTMLAAMALDKKRAREGVRWVLTPRVGHASVPRLISGRLVRKALLEAGARA
jgi:3-dehydroquinate synthase